MKRLRPAARVLALLLALGGLSTFALASAFEAHVADTSGAMVGPLWALLGTTGRKVGELGLNGVPFRFGLATTPVDLAPALEAFARTQTEKGARCLRALEGGRGVAVCLRPEGELPDALGSLLATGDPKALGELRAALAERTTDATRLVFVEASHLPIRELLEGPKGNPTIDGLSFERAVLFVTQRTRGGEEPLLVVDEESVPESATENGLRLVGARGERWLRHRPKEGGRTFWVRLNGPPASR